MQCWEKIWILFRRLGFLTSQLCQFWKIWHFSCYVMIFLAIRMLWTPATLQSSEPQETPSLISSWNELNVCFSDDAIETPMSHVYEAYGRSASSYFFGFPATTSLPVLHSTSDTTRQQLTDYLALCVVPYRPWTKWIFIIIEPCVVVCRSVGV